MDEKENFTWAKEVRFYSLLLLAGFLLIVGLYTPPEGEIAKSVLIAGGGLVTVAACVVGVDVRGIIKEVNNGKILVMNELMKEEEIKNGREKVEVL